MEIDGRDVEYKPESGPAFLGDPESMDYGITDDQTAEQWEAVMVAVAEHDELCSDMEERSNSYYA